MLGFSYLKILSNIKKPHIGNNCRCLVCMDSLSKQEEVETVKKTGKVQKEE